MPTATIDFANLVAAFPLTSIFSGVASVAGVLVIVPIARKSYSVIHSFISSRWG